ncbi:hypothetical protein EW145_g7170 [Phellinidium pouzarii]|uniref:Uncharacterized protein n=1 Tax=Phellinidium pouzarii TaxID=167371 RepID=A0A4S4KPZ9_9AGAM|nr:hypothetical protein EW145_g7170 [Phellinidium pouzarii]
MDGREFVIRVLSDLRNFAPVVIPTLFVYILESASSLKLWHAVQQTIYLKPEPSVDGSGVADPAAVDKAIEKAGSRLAIENLTLTFLLVLLVVVGQLMKINGGDALGIDFDESIFNYANWYDAYYAIALFWPVVFLNARTINILGGTSSRIVSRNAEGVPFIIIDRGESRLGYRSFVMVLSIMIAIGTVWIRNPICVAIFYASLVHVLVSSTMVFKVVTMKQQFIAALFFLCSSTIIFGLGFILRDGVPQRKVDVSSSSEIDWRALIISGFCSHWPFIFISLSYRLDHSLARPDELLVGPFSAEGAINIAGAEQLRGPIITSSFPNIVSKSPSSVATFTESFSKPYFHAALGGWFSAYVLLAVLCSTDHFTYVPEIMGMYLVYMSFPLIAIAVLVTAMVRGELRRVFAYKEDWLRKPVANSAVSVVGVGKGLKVKDPLYAKEKDELSSTSFVLK